MQQRYTWLAHLASRTFRTALGPKTAHFRILLLTLFCLASISWIAPGGSSSPPTVGYAISALGPPQATGGLPVRPYLYATPGSAFGYDVIWSDGTTERRVASIPVDGVYLADADARLSAGGSWGAVRVSGDARGGSALYLVDVRRGTHTTIASTGSAADGLGAYAWSPAAPILAYVYTVPALDPLKADRSYGAIYIYPVDGRPVKLSGSHGEDRLLGFSGDGRGVFVARTGADDEGWQEDLVYLPLSGGEGRVLLSSLPGLRFRRLAVWSPGPNTPSRAGGTRVVALAEGDVGLAQGPAPVQTGGSAPLPARSLVSTGGLAEPNGLGMVVAVQDGRGRLSRPVLLRRDAEYFSFLQWAPDGAALMMGGTSSGASWLVDLVGGRRGIDLGLAATRLLTSTPDGRVAIMSNVPTTHLITLNLNTGGVHASRKVGIEPRPTAPERNLLVPYIHQLKDTTSYADGSWACGPASTAMALAYFGKLPPWGVVASPPPSPAERTYTVQPGDTLSDLAARFGTSVDDLIATNKLNDTTIYAGHDLAIPGQAGPAPANAQPAPAAPRNYRVQPGDSLWGLADKLNIDRAALAAANDIGPDSFLYIGQVLNLPTQGALQPPRQVQAAPPAVPVVDGYPSGAVYAPYITNQYTAFGHTYDAKSGGPDGRPLAGLYGTIDPDGFASWQQIVDVLSWHGLSSRYLPVTWEAVTGALDRGHPVIIGNELTVAGHIVLAIGYTHEGDLIVHDPLGDRFAAGYGSNEGRGVYYAWKRLTARTALEVIGDR